MTTVQTDVINLIYVDFTSTEYTFFTDASSLNAFDGILNLDQLYRFYRINQSSSFPFHLEDSSFINITDSSGTYTDGISGDEYFTIEFTTNSVSDISIVSYYDTTNSFTGTFTTAFSSTSIDVTSLQQVTNYNTMLLQSDLCNNIYFLDTGDTSGYVFEISSFDTSNGLVIVAPTFDTAIQQDLALEDVSAIATIDVSLSVFNNLFAFQSDSDSINDLDSVDVTYGVNITSSDLSYVFKDVSYSFATVVENQINSYYSDQEIYSDYIRNLAFQITSGYSGVDLFTNETALTQGVQDMDLSFQASFQLILDDLIEDTSTNGFKTISEIAQLTQNDELYKAANALFVINANSGSSSQRFLDLLDDISAASTSATNISGGVGTITVPLRFSSGDKIALRLLYKTDMTNYTIVDRSYKVLLNLI
tara:strand:- start:1023 stop:2282 length:1260 start_codon:yes stop_codon:yes gene_type:complete